MANPQVENGYSPIAHEVLEALMKARLTGTQWDLVMAVIRKTWGYQEKEAFVSLTIFKKLTGRNRSLIGRELSVLQDRNILKQIETPTFGKAAKWKFNKDWESWVYAPRDTVRAEGTVTAEAGRQSSRGEPRVSPIGEPIKERRKKTLKRNIGDRVFDRWISHAVLKRHKRLTPLMSKFTNSKITAGYKEEELFLVIDNYAKLKTKGSAPGYGNWGLDKLMRNTEWFDSLLDPDWEGFNSNRGTQDEDNLKEVK